MFTMRLNVWEWFRCPSIANLRSSKNSNRGVALLHSFAYTALEEAFRKGPSRIPG